MINLNCPSQTTRAVFLGDNMNHFSYKPSGVCSQKIDFDILARGEDQNHAGFQRAEQWCAEHGKEVKVLTRTEGISSTMLRQYSREK